MYANFKRISKGIDKVKKYGLLGEKLSHSYSKTIHQYVFEKLDIDASYELLECLECDLKKYIDLLRDGIYHGYNVTIPYKKVIMNYLDEVDEKALAIGSVNTIYLKDNKVIGTNTDYDGFLSTIMHHHLNIENKNCYILGTGGASLAVAKVCKDLKGNVTFVSRTPKQGQISYEELKNGALDVLINTTPVGMYPNVDASPVDEATLKRAKIVIDIIFNPKQTLFLKYANSNINGLHMLMMQALKAEEIWQKEKIDIDLNALEEVLL